MRVADGAFGQSAAVAVQAPPTELASRRVASRRGKRLHTSGRKIKVDLRGKTEGNYNVVIAAKYKTKHGKLHTVRSVRTLSITRS